MNTMRARSMTGFAQAAEGAVTVTVKSWNQRHLEPHWQVPPACEARVPAWTALLRALARRGRVEVRVQVAAAPGAAQLDWGAVDAYVASFSQLAARLGSDERPRAADILRLPGIFAAPAAASAEAENGDFDAAFGLALEAWDQSRAGEAEALVADVRRRVERLGKLRAEATVQAAIVAAELRARLLGAS